MRQSTAYLVAHTTRRAPMQPVVRRRLTTATSSRHVSVPALACGGSAPATSSGTSLSESALPFQIFYTRCSLTNNGNQCQWLCLQLDDHLRQPRGAHQV